MNSRGMREEDGEGWSCIVESIEYDTVLLVTILCEL